MSEWFEADDAIASAARTAWMPDPRHRTPWLELQESTRVTWRRVAQAVLDAAMRRKLGEPDAVCLVAPNGECYGIGPCAHSAPPQMNEKER